MYIYTVCHRVAIHMHYGTTVWCTCEVNYFLNITSCSSYGMGYYHSHLQYFPVASAGIGDLTHLYSLSARNQANI